MYTIYYLHEIYRYCVIIYMSYSRSPGPRESGPRWKTRSPRSGDPGKCQARGSGAAHQVLKRLPCHFTSMATCFTCHVVNPILYKGIYLPTSLRSLSCTCALFTCSSRWTRQDIAPVSWSDLDLVRAHLSYRAVRQVEPAAQLGFIRAGIDDTTSRQDRLSTGSSELLTASGRCAPREESRLGRLAPQRFPSPFEQDLARSKLSTRSARQGWLAPVSNIFARSQKRRFLGQSASFFN